MPLRAVIFDFDGLIIDTELSSYETACAVFVEHGAELDRGWWESIIGVSDHPHWTEILEEQLGRPLDDRDAVIERRRVLHAERIGTQDLQPGVVTLLDALDDAGVATAIASSSPETWVGDHLTQRGLRDRFQYLSTREKVERGKPAPDVYAAAVDALGVAPGDAVALDDAPTGITSAKAAGLAAVGVPSTMTSALDFSHADLVVGSLVEVDVDLLTTLV